MFTPKELALERGWPGRIEGDRVIQLAAQTLQSFFTGGGHAREHAEFALADVELRAPDGTSELDYELEVAAVIGAGGAIAGFTVMNDWSARDLQRMEMRVGLGPAKGKDFATSLGPVVVTPDEFDGSSATMVARVNGDERSRGELGDMQFSWEAIVAHASRNTHLRAGDVLGSGTVGTGCILEHGDGRWLQRGDVVELEVEGIGVLRNAVI